MQLVFISFNLRHPYEEVPPLTIKKFHPFLKQPLLK